MDSPSSASTPPAWQTAVDPRLTRRLMRPLKRPGVIGTRLASSVVSRLQRMAGGFSLLPRLAQRWSSPEASATGQLPIVYAQPALPAVSTAAAAPVASTAAPVNRPIVQAKMARTSSPSARPLRTMDDGGRWTDDSGQKTEAESSPSSVTRSRSLRPSVGGPPSHGAVAQSNHPLSSVVQSDPPSHASVTHNPSLSVTHSGPPSSVAQNVPPSSVLRLAQRSSVSSSALPVVQPRRASGNVAQRKSISNIPPSVSRQTPDVIQRKAVDTTIQRAISAEMPSPSSSYPQPSTLHSLPVVRPRAINTREPQPERELSGAPALKVASPIPLASPIPAQGGRVVVRPLTTLPAASHIVQRALDWSQSAAATPETGFISSPSLPVSMSGNHPSFKPGNEAQAQPVAPLAVSHTPSTPPVIQRQAAPASGKTEAREAVIQRAPRRGGGGGTDIDELAEKVQAKLAHWLSVESERRGLTRWD